MTSADSHESSGVTDQMPEATSSISPAVDAPTEVQSEQPPQPSQPDGADEHWSAAATGTDVEHPTEDSRVEQAANPQSATMASRLDAVQGEQGGAADAEAPHSEARDVNQEPSI
jgi:hypothetical protein